MGQRGVGEPALICALGRACTCARTHTHTHTHTHTQRQEELPRGRVGGLCRVDSALPTTLYKFCIISAMNSFLHSKTDSSKGREGPVVG